MSAQFVFTSIVPDLFYEHPEFLFQFCIEGEEEYVFSIPFIECANGGDYRHRQRENP